MTGSYPNCKLSRLEPEGNEEVDGGWSPFKTTAGPVSASSSSGAAPMAGEMSSFYLSAVPTEEEKLSGIKGKWTRKGVWAFRFDIKV